MKERLKAILKEEKSNGNIDVLLEWDDYYNIIIWRSKDSLRKSIDMAEKAIDDIEYETVIDEVTKKVVITEPVKPKKVGKPEWTMFFVDIPDNQMRILKWGIADGFNYTRKPRVTNKTLEVFKTDDLAEELNTVIDDYIAKAQDDAVIWLDPLKKDTIKKQFQDKILDIENRMVERYRPLWLGYENRLRGTYSNLYVIAGKWDIDATIESAENIRATILGRLEALDERVAWLEAHKSADRAGWNQKYYEDLFTKWEATNAVGGQLFTVTIDDALHWVNRNVRYGLSEEIDRIKDLDFSKMSLQEKVLMYKTLRAAEAATDSAVDVLADSLKAKVNPRIGKFIDESTNVTKEVPADATVIVGDVSSVELPKRLWGESLVADFAEDLRKAADLAPEEPVGDGIDILVKRRIVEAIAKASNEWKMSLDELEKIIDREVPKTIKENTGVVERSYKWDNFDEYKEKLYEAFSDYDAYDDIKVDDATLKAYEQKIETDEVVDSLFTAEDKDMLSRINIKLPSWEVNLGSVDIRYGDNRLADSPINSAKWNINAEKKIPKDQRTQFLDAKRKVETEEDAYIDSRAIAVQWEEAFNQSRFSDTGTALSALKTTKRWQRYAYIVANLGTEAKRTAVALRRAKNLKLDELERFKSEVKSYIVGWSTKEPTDWVGKLAKEVADFAKKIQDEFGELTNDADINAGFQNITDSFITDNPDVMRSLANIITEAKYFDLALANIPDKQIRNLFVMDKQKLGIQTWKDEAIEKMRRAMSDNADEYASLGKWKYSKTMRILDTYATQTLSGVAGSWLFNNALWNFIRFNVKATGFMAGAFFKAGIQLSGYATQRFISYDSSMESAKDVMKKIDRGKAEQGSIEDLWDPKNNLGDDPTTFFGKIWWSAKNIWYRTSSAEIMQELSIGIQQLSDLAFRQQQREIALNYAVQNTANRRTFSNVAEFNRWLDTTPASATKDAVIADVRASASQRFEHLSGFGSYGFSTRSGRWSLWVRDAMFWFRGSWGRNMFRNLMKNTLGAGGYISVKMAKDLASGKGLKETFDRVGDFLNKNQEIQETFWSFFKALRLSSKVQRLDQETEVNEKRNRTVKDEILDSFKMLGNLYMPMQAWSANPFTRTAEDFVRNMFMEDGLGERNTVSRGVYESALNLMRQMFRQLKVVTPYFKAAQIMQEEVNKKWFARWALEGAKLFWSEMNKISSGMQRYVSNEVNDRYGNDKLVTVNDWTMSFLFGLSPEKKLLYDSYWLQSELTMKQKKAEGQTWSQVVKDLSSNIVVVRDLFWQLNRWKDKAGWTIIYGLPSNKNIDELIEYANNIPWYAESKRDLKIDLSNSSDKVKKKVYQEFANMMVIDETEIGWGRIEEQRNAIAAGLDKADMPYATAKLRQVLWDDGTKTVTELLNSVPGGDSQKIMEFAIAIDALVSEAGIENASSYTMMRALAKQYNDARVKELKKETKATFGKLALTNEQKDVLNKEIYDLFWDSLSVVDMPKFTQLLERTYLFETAREQSELGDANAEAAEKVLSYFWHTEWEDKNGVAYENYGLRGKMEKALLQTNLVTRCVLENETSCSYIQSAFTDMGEFLDDTEGKAILANHINRTLKSHWVAEDTTTMIMAGIIANNPELANDPSWLDISDESKDQILQWLYGVDENINRLASITAQQDAEDLVSGSSGGKSTKAAKAKVESMEWILSKAKNLISSNKSYFKSKYNRDGEDFGGVYMPKWYRDFLKKKWTEIDRIRESRAASKSYTDVDKWGTKSRKLKSISKTKPKKPKLK
jgi:hypothetical protein